MIPEIQIKLLYFILNITFSEKVFLSTAIETDKPDPNLQGSTTSFCVFKKTC